MIFLKAFPPGFLKAFPRVGIIFFVGVLFPQRLLLQEVIKPYDLAALTLYLMPLHLFHYILHSTEVLSFLHLSPQKLDIEFLSSRNLIVMPSYNKDEELALLLAQEGL